MKMRKKLITALVLGACVGTQAFAQNIKQDTITFSLSLQGQSSVSTSPSAANAGNFSQGPLYYKTKTTKFTQADLLKAISYVMHHHNAGYYTSQASLQLVQGELGGFWNIDDGLAQSYEDVDLDGFLPGSFNDCGNADSNPTYSALNAVFFPNGGFTTDGDPYGEDFTGLGLDFSQDIPNFVDRNSRTSISDGQNEYLRLDTGRHFLPVPWQSYGNQNGVPYLTTGQYPVGHMQPWGQVYVRDPGHKDAQGLPLCENVTFFFYLTVQECYDCFYLNSFISDATFKVVPGAAGGPPCCTSPNTLMGRGVDKYYLSLSFDNTENNSYLNDSVITNRSSNTDLLYYYEYVGFRGIAPITGVADGLTPDLLTYSDPIRSRLGLASPYETRFTLNGIVTYNWTLTLVNKTDIAADYVGTANYAANGYGFIGLICDLITGTATFSEKVVKDIGCCDDVLWSCDDVINGPLTACLNCNGQPDDNESIATGWYGPGEGETHGYFNPRYHQYNPYPYFDIVGGDTYASLFVQDLPRQHESPFNPSPALTKHMVNIPHLDINNDDEDDVFIPLL